MKQIVAYLRSEQLPAVRSALANAKFPSYTVMPVLGTAPKSDQQVVRGVKREVTLFKRVRLETLVTDDRLEAAIEAISLGAKENGGWGRIAVTDVHEVVKIWTDERGESALA
jgi:nitrogen regulatory protein P-II 1